MEITTSALPDQPASCEPRASLRKRRLVCGLVLALCAWSHAVGAQERTRVAITVDDLPAAGVPVPGWSEARILGTIAAVLHAHHVPEPIGFFNGGNMDTAPETKDALAAWLRAGFLLGNHTYSHLSANQVDAQTFVRDIARDQALIVELDQYHASRSRYFRYPYLERGSTLNDPMIRRYLAQHRYRIADVSLDFEDWAFSAAYGRCSAEDDQPALSALRDSYLAYALSELAWSRDSLERIAGRKVPLVLLLHANFMTAQLLDRLLSEYERAGVRFVSAREALADGIYALAQTKRHGDSTLIEALLRERHVHAIDRVTLPLSLLDALCHGTISAP